MNRKRIPKFLAAVPFLASSLALAPVGALAKIVCWTNSDGVRECGNSLPPEYAQQSSVRKSSLGITVEQTARAKTAEELAAERAERERTDRERAEREQLRAEQARRDRVLLQTFTTEEDLLLARDGKIAAINSRIKHGEQLVGSLQENLAELEAEAARLERSGQKVSPELQKNIADLRAQIGDSRVELERREAERVAVNARFEADLDRYRELKGTVSQ